MTDFSNADFDITDCNQIDDETIAEWVRSGDAKGLACLLGKYGGRVHAYLKRRFPSFDEDALQDVFADALLAVERTFDPAKGQIGAWLMFLAYQRGVDYLRSHRGWDRETPVGDDWEFLDQRADPTVALATQEDWKQVRQALSRLSSLERAVIEADLECGGRAEASVLATRLKTTERSIYSARTRARGKLTRLLADYFQLPLDVYPDQQDSEENTA